MNAGKTEGVEHGNGVYECVSIFWALGEDGILSNLAG